MTRSCWSGLPSGGRDRGTGLSRLFEPGMPSAMFAATGLAHDEGSNVAYISDVNPHGKAMPSRKLPVLQTLPTPPRVHGDESGDLPMVGWGSTRGAIGEAVERAPEGRASPRSTSRPWSRD